MNTYSTRRVSRCSEYDSVLRTKTGASLGGPTMGQIGWGGPSTGPTLFFGAAGVFPCRCEPLRAGCCGGEGVLGVS